MKEPREFWVWGKEKNAGDFVTEHRGFGEEMNATHVIEKSAYDKAVEALKSARKSLILIADSTNFPENVWCEKFASEKITDMGEVALNRARSLDQTLKELGEI